MSIYPWGNNRRYNSYASYFKNTVGYRLQKLSVDAGFTCPNRFNDYTARLSGTDTAGEGCTFCNNSAFNPNYCTPLKSITQQLDEGIEFHLHRYSKAGGYLAYFQAYSNTFAPLNVLKERYEEALRHPLVKGIIIGTRPDCVDEKKLDYISSLTKEYYVAVEYGIESCYDDTLQRIHRGHDFEVTRRAIALTAERGINCGGHIILGLPGESREMMLKETNILNKLPINTLKMHQLQILKGTAMERELETAKPTEGEWGVGRGFALEEYISLVCDMLEMMRPDIMMERFAGEVPPRYQACPQRSWRRADGRLIRNEEIPVLVEKELERRGTYQSCRFCVNQNN